MRYFIKFCYVQICLPSVSYSFEKKDDDKELLQEVIHEEPYQFPFGSTKRGAVWTKIADNLAKRGLVKATRRSVLHRFNSLLEEYHTREREEKLAGGIEVEYDLSLIHI